MQFASSTRQADIVVLVDSSAGTKTAPFNRPSFTCHDDGDVCQTKVYYNAKDAANKRCCNACALPMVCEGVPRRCPRSVADSLADC